MPMQYARGWVYADNGLPPPGRRVGTSHIHSAGDEITGPVGFMSVDRHGATAWVLASSPDGKTKLASSVRVPA